MRFAGWVCLTCLNCSIFSGLGFISGLYLPQNPSRPGGGKFPKPKRDRRLLSTGCETWQSKKKGKPKAFNLLNLGHAIIPGQSLLLSVSDFCHAHTFTFFSSNGNLNYFCVCVCVLITKREAKRSFHRFIVLGLSQNRWENCCWLLLFSAHTYECEAPLQEASHIPAASMKTDCLYILLNIAENLWI